MLSDIAVPIAVTCGVPLVLSWTRRRAPFQPPPELSADEIERLRKKYIGFEGAMLPVFFIITAGLTWLFTLLFWWGDERHLSSMPANLFLITPQPRWGIWMIPSIFLGIIGSALPLEILTRLLLRENYKTYLLATQLRHGYSFKKVVPFLFIGTIVLSAVLCVLLFDWYSRFENDRIVVNPLLGLGEREYRYSDINKLVEASQFVAPSGSLVVRTRRFIVFKDGSRWCTDDFGTPHRLDETFDKLFEFLCEKTHQDIVQVKFLEDALK